MGKPVKLTDLHPATGDLLQEVLEGLQRPVKELPAKLLYDEQGSLLFEAITRLEEYYPTRTEMAIMSANIDAMGERIGPRAMLIELGSGNSEKTRILLDHIDDLVAYTPVDISKELLMISARKINERYPALEVLPLCADYNGEFDLPLSTKPVERRVIYYPGSTIGNFHPHQAVEFMRRLAAVEGEGSGLLIGVDLKKDPLVLHQAYNDRQGITADFNLNMLRRLNRELDCDFDLERFCHRAIYDRELGRIEMHLVSLAKQTVHVGGAVVRFDEGESIWTESSYKYSIEEFSALAGDAGFEVSDVWTDNQQLFSVQYLTVSSATAR